MPQSSIRIHGAGVCADKHRERVVWPADDTSFSNPEGTNNDVVEQTGFKVDRSRNAPSGWVRGRRRVPVGLSATTAESVRVLVVEDDESDFVLTRDMLAGQDHTLFAVDWCPD